MSGTGLHANTVELVNAANGFAKQAKDIQTYASALDAELKPYATNPERFQGPPADEFRRLYREISDDLEVVRQEAQAMSELVEEAKRQYGGIADQWAQTMHGTTGGGGHVLNGLT